MLHTQKYLRGGKSPADLKAELGIESFEHPTLPLVGFSYHMTQSPKTHPIVRECRGMVLEKDTWTLVAKGFDRFYNAGEDGDNWKTFDWSNFEVTEKCDGTMILMYCYRGQWLINTRNTFGNATPRGCDKTWTELFLSTIPSRPKNFSPSCTYVFELCTPHNRLVTNYNRSHAFLLAAFVVEDWAGGFKVEEYPSSWIQFQRDQWKVELPKMYVLRSRDELDEFIYEKEATDKRFEGVVIRDSKGLRYKVKSATYEAYHRILNTKDNRPTDRDLFHLVYQSRLHEGHGLDLTEQERDKVRWMERQLDEEFDRLATVWDSVRTIEDQSQFARRVSELTKIPSILFQMKKIGPKADNEDLTRLLRRSMGYAGKMLFKISG